MSIIEAKIPKHKPPGVNSLACTPPTQWPACNGTARSLYSNARFLLFDNVVSKPRMSGGGVVYYYISLARKLRSSYVIAQAGEESVCVRHENCKARRRATLPICHVYRKASLSICNKSRKAVLRIKQKLASSIRRISNFRIIMSHQGMKSSREI